MGEREIDEHITWKERFQRVDAAIKRKEVFAMAYRIALQPNGKLALFDTVGQEIVVYDANEKGIVDYMAERQRPELEERVARMAAKAGLYDFKECVEAMLEVHGAAEVDPILNAMEPEKPCSTS